MVQDSMRRRVSKEREFMEIRVTKSQHQWLTNQKYQSNEPFDSVLFRVIVGYKMFRQEHPEAVWGIHSRSLESYNQGEEGSSTLQQQIKYEWMNDVQKYEAQLGLGPGVNPYDLLKMEEDRYKALNNEYVKLKKEYDTRNDIDSNTSRSGSMVRPLVREENKE